MFGFNPAAFARRVKHRHLRREVEAFKDQFMVYQDAANKHLIEKHHDDQDASNLISDEIATSANRLVRSIRSTLSSLETSLLQGDVRNAVEIARSVISSSDEDPITRYYDFFETIAHAFEADGRQYVGTPFQDFVLQRVLNRNGTFNFKAQQVPLEEIGNSVVDEFQHWLTGMREIYEWDLTALTEEYASFMAGVYAKLTDVPVEEVETRHIPPITDFTPMKKDRKSSSAIAKVREKELELRSQMHDLQDWSQMPALISAHFMGAKDILDIGLYEIGVRKNQPYLRIKPNEEPESLDELVGIDDIKGRLVTNTEMLVSGNRASNGFLYGPTGVGKSALMGALGRRFYDEGLRMLELATQEIPALPMLYSTFEESGYFWMVVVDEFKITKEGKLFDPIKKALDGAFDKMPDCMVVYFVSNRDDALRRPGYLEDGEEDIDPLGDRVGLHLKFEHPEMDALHERLLRAAGLRDPAYSERRSALIQGFATYIGGRKQKPSFRTVNQYVDSLPIDAKLFAA